MCVYHLIIQEEQQASVGALAVWWTGRDVHPREQVMGERRCVSEEEKGELQHKHLEREDLEQNGNRSTASKSRGGKHQYRVNDHVLNLRVRTKIY